MTKRNIAIILFIYFLNQIPPLIATVLLGMPVGSVNIMKKKIPYEIVLSFKVSLSIWFVQSWKRGGFVYLVCLGIKKKTGNEDRPLLVMVAFREFSLTMTFFVHQCPYQLSCGLRPFNHHIWHCAAPCQYCWVDTLCHTAKVNKGLKNKTKQNKKNELAIASALTFKILP